ncbi:MAG: DUF5131 family protein [Armatimonadota bacterium]
MNRIDWLQLGPQDGHGGAQGETLNPIVGCTANCKDPNGRPYCYARKMAPRTARFCDQRVETGNRWVCGWDDAGPVVENACETFFPHFHPERLEKLAHWKKPRRIFMDSMSDWWDPNVKQEWRDECYAAMAANPQHRYLVLTKQPQNLSGWDGDDAWFWQNECAWIGVTIEGLKQEMRQGQVPEVRRFVSAEPLFEPFLITGSVKWLILGADSRRNPYLPGEEAFWEMIRQADDLRIPVFLKDNALKAYPNLPERREWPEGLLI